MRGAASVYARFAGMALFAFLLDFVAKWVAEQTLTLAHPVPMLGQWARLTLSYNSGVAFSVLATSGSLLVVGMTGVITAGLLVWSLCQFRRGHLPRAVAWPLGLILGSALGNLVDRLPDWRVTHMVDLGVGAARFATFNLADTCITVGVCWLLLVLLLRPQSAEGNGNRA